MMRSMYASVAGLKVHQTMMDIIGNNISNINTVAYKGSRVTFKEMLSQTIKGAAAPNQEQGKGGTNPVQIGLGVSLGSIDSDMSTGNLQPTGKQSDVAVQGDGFFIVNDGHQDYYTRAGSFSFDKEGYLYSSTSGFRVRGWVADENGSLANLGPDTVTNIILDKSMNPQATENVSYKGNLDAGQENGLTFNPNKVKMNINGFSDNLTASFTNTSDYNTWEIDLGCDNSVFDASGQDTMKVFMNLSPEGEVVSLEDENGVDITGTGLAVNVAGDVANQITLDLPAVNDIMTKGDANQASFLSSANIDENMAANYELKAQRTVTANVFDSLGKQHSVKYNIVKTANNRWEIDEDGVEIDFAEEPATGFLGGGDHSIMFDPSGNVIDGESLTLSFDPYGGLGTQTLRLDLSDITQYADVGMSADYDTVDGYPMGEFQSFAIDPNGLISGSFSNGQNKILAKLGLAMFTNPAGLQRSGGLLKVSNNSGLPRIGEPGMGGRGKMAPGTLEMSNVDLSEQFTEMITAQRGFQASSKLITTSDEMMQQLVNLKR